MQFPNGESEDQSRNGDRRSGRGDRRTGRRDRRSAPNSYADELSNSRALMAAIELHDPATARHSRSTVRLAVAVAERLGMSADPCTEVRLVAMLHDVGKLALPDRLVSKPSALTPGETALMQEHPAAGARVVSQVRELAHLGPAIRACHERWDGRGYPDGLAAEEIPLASRITFVCDAYDAMVSGRPYSRTMSPEEARAEIRRCAGTQFCADAAEALLQIVAPAGAPAGAP